MDIILLFIAFFFISIIGVSTGGLSLITIPLLIFAGLSPQEAIATNMLGLIFLSLSGAAGFAGSVKKIPLSLIVKLSLLTSLASFGGARIVLILDETLLRNIIAVVILFVTLLVFFGKKLGISQFDTGIRRRGAGWVVIFILGIYGGFFSGAYITMLTYTFLFFWGITFLQAAGLTKILNFFSSTAACIFFVSAGVVNFRYALPLAVAMFAGGYLGARIAVLKGNYWFRYVFLTAAMVMGVAILVF